MSIASPGDAPYTIDEWLQLISRSGIWQSEGEYGLSNDVHAVAAVLDDWKRDNLSNGQAADILNLDTADPEAATLKTNLNAMAIDAVISLHRVMDLAAKQVSTTVGAGKTYDKAMLRSRLGLT